ncbi:MAG TPA: LON peptidase substrate-binding domain-containing protein [Candidatus Sulfotelmatobacter sp.]|nr:LON peptidase substrate-binding domain-containing protein [Candidatus Sulfotelmatobacter sp.]
MSAILELPIFPLPDVVLFPHTLLPLHIFEPRYRKMVQACLGGNKRLAMALLQPGWENDYYGRPPVYPLAGAGEIVHHEELKDGRFNILVRGTMRVGIVTELRSEQPFRVARVRPIPDRYPMEGSQALTARVESLKVFYIRILAEVQKGQPEPAKVFSGIKDPGIITDRIASAAIADTDIRQKVLEAVDVPTRIALVQEHLIGVLARVSDRNAPAERAPGRHN